MFNGHRVFSWDEANILELNRDSGYTTLCDYSKYHWIAHFKMVNFMLWEFYPNLQKKVIKPRTVKPLSVL